MPYIDPGTGSLVMQLIFALVLGGLASVRRVRRWFGKQLRRLGATQDGREDSDR